MAFKQQDVMSALHDYVINVFVNISLKNTKIASVASLFCFAKFLKMVDAIS